MMNKRWMPTMSPATMLIALQSVVFSAGIATGWAVEKDALNWGSGSGVWMIGVTDRYELRLNRPVLASGLVPGNVNARTYSLSNTPDGIVRVHPLDAEIRLVPYTLSGRWTGMAGFKPETDVRLAFTQTTPVHTNDGGEIRIEGHHAGSGPSISANSFVPPRLGATFVIGDGQNAVGGYSFYELRIRQGRIWSEGFLSRFDCAPTGVFGTCQEVSLKAALKVGPVQHIHRRLGGVQVNGMTPPEDMGGGTLVQAEVLLAPDAEQATR